MISTEFKKGADLPKFHEEQKNLIEDMKKILEHTGVSNLKIEPSIIFISIILQKFTKHYLFIPSINPFGTLINISPSPTFFSNFVNFLGDEVVKTGCKVSILTPKYFLFL